jgi:RNA-directed DNA polymerase
MRSLPDGTFDRIADPLTLWRAWRRTAAGKRRGPVVARHAIDADRDLFALRRELLTGRYRPRPWRLRIVYDPKPRLIAAPAVRDRIVHRALLDVVGRHFTRRCIDTHFTCGAGRGLHQAVVTLLALNRRFAWRMHLDIARYFPSVDHGILQELLCGQIRDRRVCALIATILASGLGVYHSAEANALGLRPPGRDERPRGLPLGSWFSQWAGAYYLDGLDHYVKRALKIPGYLRYMDDFVQLGDDRGLLVEARLAVSEWLRAQRGLTLNPKLGQIEPTVHPTVLLGHRISRSGIAPSGRMRRRFRERVAGPATDPDQLSRPDVGAVSSGRCRPPVSGVHEHSKLELGRMGCLAGAWRPGEGIVQQSHKAIEQIPTDATSPTPDFETTAIPGTQPRKRLSMADRQHRDKATKGTRDQGFEPRAPERAQRNPMKTWRDPGTSLSRYAERRTPGSPAKEPPRSTRRRPRCGPTGSSTWRPS